MAEYSRFFGSGGLIEYSQPQFAEVLEKIFTNGVFTDILNELEVVEIDPVALAVRVNSGEGWINGFWYQNTAYLTKSLAAADPDDDRIDRIILRLDTTTNLKISVEVLEGTPAGSPSAPELTTTASIYEISLAQVLVAEDATSVNDGDITDERTYAAVSNAPVTLTNAVTLTNKTLTAPIISTLYQDAGKTKTITMPAATDTLVGKATTDTLTNKTLTSPVFTGTIDGWITANETWTYASADAPTYTITVPTDATTKYSAGMRIKLTHGGSVKYFIITKVEATVLTLYGGTDYTLADTAITLPYYSMVKAPLGFPLSPAKWTVPITDTTIRSQANPTQNAWYNLGSVSINVPIGCWRIRYDVASDIGGNIRLKITLSTANNSESNSNFSSIQSGATLMLVHSREDRISVTSKTPYYINTSNLSDSTTTIYNRNDLVPLNISAICAYL